MSAPLRDRHIGGLLLAILVLVSMSGTASAADASATQPIAFDTVEYTWHDAARNRDVPVKIYYPTAASAPVPIIIFSHGLGGSREGYQYLGQYWAAHGYASVHLQHIGSDDSVWKSAGGLGALSQAANARNAVDRCKDVSFAIDQLEKLNGDDTSPLKGQLDLTKIGMSGHSFGGQTTMAIAGQMAIVFGRQISNADPRIKAAIAMSPPVPVIKANDQAAYALIKMPVFVLTGTEDNSPIGKTTAADRRIAYDFLAHAPAYLLTFKGGDHMVFSGRLGGENRPNDALFQSLILKGTTAFWDTHLRGDEHARAYLENGGFAQDIGASGAFEMKMVGSSISGK